LISSDSFNSLTFYDNPMTTLLSSSIVRDTTYTGAMREIISHIMTEELKD